MQAITDTASDATNGGPLDAPTADAVSCVEACLRANHANTLALCACLRAADVACEDALPYREVEAAVAADPSLGLSTQTPHTLIGLLVKAGGIARVEVPESPAPAVGPAEPGEPAESAPAADAASVAGEPVAPAPAVAQPVDYLLHITEAGRAALASFDPAVQFGALIAAEPDGYLDAYARVLDACAEKDGAALAAIEGALAGHPALVSPKRVFPGYFVSKLETIGGISWDGAWRVTKAGEQMLAAFA